MVPKIDHQDKWFQTKLPNKIDTDSQKESRQIALVGIGVLGDRGIEQNEKKR